MEKSLNIALLQTEGRSLKDRAKAREEIFSKIDQAIKEKADIIVLPECAFPSYNLSDWNETVNEECEKMTEDLKTISALHNCYIVCGLPREIELMETCKSFEKRRLFNSAFVFNPKGEIELIADKQFLWHFDSKWFNKSRHSSFFNTKWGKIGLIICADARIPEITQSLRLLGCKLIIDCTNLVSVFTEPEKRSNPQSTYMLPIRAYENGVWIAAVNKVGIEDDFIVFSGTSMFIDPSGDIVKKASNNVSEIIYLDIPVLPVNGEIDCSKAYVFAQRDDKSMGTNIKADFSNFSKEHIYMSSARLHDFVSLKQGFVSILQRAELVGTDLLNITIKAKEPICDIEDMFFEQLKDIKICSIVDYHTEDDRRCYLINQGKMICIEESCLIDTTDLKVGIIFDEDIINIDISRTMMVNGANIIIWLNCKDIKKYYDLVRTRAMENRVYTAYLGSDSKEMMTISSPDGVLLTESGKDCNQLISSYLDINLTRRKTVVPNTDVLFGAAVYKSF